MSIVFITPQVQIANLYDLLEKSLGGAVVLAPDASQVSSQLRYHFPEKSVIPLDEDLLALPMKATDFQNVVFDKYFLVLSERIKFFGEIHPHDNIIVVLDKITYGTIKSKKENLFEKEKEKIFFM